MAPEAIRDQIFSSEADVVCDYIYFNILEEKFYFNCGLKWMLAVTVVEIQSRDQEPYPDLLPIQVTLIFNFNLDLK